MRRLEHRLGMILSKSTLKHFTDEVWCWCEPDVFRVCPECDGEGLGCWECESTGLLALVTEGRVLVDPALFPSESLIVVHRDR